MPSSCRPGSRLGLPPAYASAWPGSHPHGSETVRAWSVCAALGQWPLLATPSCMHSHTNVWSTIPRPMHPSAPPAGDGPFHYHATIARDRSNQHAPSSDPWQTLEHPTGRLTCHTDGACHHHLCTIRDDGILASRVPQMPLPHLCRHLRVTNCWSLDSRATRIDHHGYRYHGDQGIMGR